MTNHVMKIDRNEPKTTFSPRRVGGQPMNIAPFPTFSALGMGDRSGLPDDKIVFIFYFLCLSVVLG
jgi:hypothetical protein